MGAIIGKINIIQTVRTEDIWELEMGQEHEGSQNELAFGDYSPGRYGWLLSDPVQFANPIPAKGKLSIWEYKL